MPGKHQLIHHATSGRISYYSVGAKNSPVVFVTNVIFLGSVFQYRSLRDKITRNGREMRTEFLLILRVLLRLHFYLTAHVPLLESRVLHFDWKMKVHTERLLMYRSRLARVTSKHRSRMKGCKYESNPSFTRDQRVRPNKRQATRK